ncbi:MAG: DUF4326 domain-containing protein [Xanthomonadales bacterium]|nr:DUF4326 domain-containing protein [Xanthomonadales bacterium]
MTDLPHRIRLSRRKGWRLPPGTVSVARPGRFGDPFRVDGDQDACTAVKAFRDWLATPACPAPLAEARQRLLVALPSLRGRDLACWCALDAPCHADVLVELANSAVEPRPQAPPGSATAAKPRRQRNPA